MSETECPNCGARKERIAQHWAKSSCGYPEIQARIRAVLDALILSGGTIAGNGPNRHLTVGTANETFAEWVADQLEWLHHGTRETVSESTGSRIYRIRTPAHPAINRYERWERAPESKGRMPPSQFDLTQRTARVWYADAGGLLFREYDSQRSAIFAAKFDDKADWIQCVLRDVGFEPTRQSKRVQLPPTETARLLSWVGPPVSGMEHKWRISNVGDRPIWKNGREYPDEALLNALRNAADLLEHPPSKSDFETWRPRSYPSAKTIQERAGGSWHQALEDAGLDVTEKLEVHSSHGARYSSDLLIAAVHEADDAISGRLTVDGYQDWRRHEQEAGRRIPSTTPIVQRFGRPWRIAVDRILDDESHT